MQLCIGDFIQRFSTFLAVPMLGLLCASASAQSIWYVDGDIQTPGDGTEWSLAFGYLGDALANPLLNDGDSVWVKGGSNAEAPLIYYCDESAANPNGSDLATATFLISKQIRLLGGFAGTEEFEFERGDFLAHPVWLSGDVKHEDPPGQIVTLDDYTAAFLSDPPNYATLADNALHTVTVRGAGINSTNCLIDGFASIRGGYARVFGSVVNSDVGGGMFCDGVSPLIRACNFEFNLSLGDMVSRVGSGGGLYDTSARLEIREAIFRNNHSALAGGGLCKHMGDLLAVRCRFERNWSFQTGGPTASVGSGGRGGGLRVNLFGGEAQVISCSFRENRSRQFGGGVSVGWPFSPDLPPIEESDPSSCLGLLLPESLAVFTNCLFEGNLVDGTPGGCGGFGGGLRTSHHTEVRNCSFARNAAVFGAAIMANHEAEVKIFNSIIWDNINLDPPPDPPSTCSPSYTAFEEQIFVCQTSPSSCFLAIHDSCVQGLASAASQAATCGWTNNIEMNPKFFDGDDATIDGDGSDYNLRLIAASPCIDAADNGNLPEDLGDLDGDSQTVGQDLPYDLDDTARVKFGTSSATVDMGAFEASCLGDIDGNGMVNGLDLASLLSGWDEEGYEPCPPYHGGDLDGDCEVDGMDLALLLGAWGPCPDVGESAGSAAAAGGAGAEAEAAGGPEEAGPDDQQFQMFIEWFLAGDWAAFLQWSQQQPDGS